MKAIPYREYVARSIDNRTDGTPIWSETLVTCDEWFFALDFFNGIVDEKIIELVHQEAARVGKSLSAISGIAIVPDHIVALIEAPTYGNSLDYQIADFKTAFCVKHAERHIKP